MRERTCEWHGGRGRRHARTQRRDLPTLSSHAAVTTLRFFFDTGAGVCLWHAPDAAGDAVALHELPLSANAVRLAEAAMALHDLQVDWSSPAEPGPYWDAATRATFAALATQLLHVLRTELAAHGYRIVDAR